MIRPLGHVSMPSLWQDLNNDCLTSVAVELYIQNHFSSSVHGASCGSESAVTWFFRFPFVCRSFNVTHSRQPNVICMKDTCLLPPKHCRKSPRPQEVVPRPSIVRARITELVATKRSVRKASRLSWLPQRNGDGNSPPTHAKMLSVCYDVKERGRETVRERGSICFHGCIQ